VGRFRTRTVAKTTLGPTLRSGTAQGRPDQPDVRSAVAVVAAGGHVLQTVAGSCVQQTEQRHVQPQVGRKTGTGHIGRAAVRAGRDNGEDVGGCGDRRGQTRRETGRTRLRVQTFQTEVSVAQRRGHGSDHVELIL